MKKRTIIILVTVLVLAMMPIAPVLAELVTARTEMPTDVKEGDVIFQTSKSRQSPLIQWGTQSKISHCGVIVMKGGEPYVLETLKTLQLTPLKSFIVRGQGGKYWLKRSDKKNIKIKYTHYLGKPYDKAFKMDNNIYYCSELVYDIYIKQLGIELCKPKKVSDYLILGINHYPALEKEMKNRDIKMEQEVVAPVAVFESEYLHNVD